MHFDGIWCLFELCWETILVLFYELERVFQNDYWSPLLTLAEYLGPDSHSTSMYYWVTLPCSTLSPVLWRTAPDGGTPSLRSTAS